VFPLSSRAGRNVIISDFQGRQEKAAAYLWHKSTNAHCGTALTHIIDLLLILIHFNLITLRDVVVWNWALLKRGA